MSNPRHNTRDIYPPTGPEITAKSWLTEAPMRMLMNNLHPDVAENPHELVVYGGIGRAARTWNDFDRIVAGLKDLEDDETLVVQSGKPVAIVRTHKDAPRVLIANSNIVPHWANWDHFSELDRKGLMMYGQMTAGSWIYIGTQGIVQGTYETFAEAGRQHYGGDLTGRWILTGGLGGMGGAQPLAAVFAGACCLAVECNPDSIDFRLRTKYLDEKADTLDEALELIDRWTKAGEAKSVGLLGNAADIFPEIHARGIRPDIVTDQTSAHDPVNGYLPQGWTLGEWRSKRESDPKAVEAAARASMKVHVKAMVDFWNDGVPTLDYGNNIRQVALEEGLGKRLCVPRLRPRLYPSALLQGHRSLPLVRAVRRPRGHLQDRPGDEGTLPRKHPPSYLAGHGAGPDRISGSPGADLLDWPGGSSSRGPEIQRDGGLGRTESARRHRTRPPRQRLRGQPQPGNRGDAGWIRRRERLAASERAGEHGLRCHLGQPPPRRWRWHGLQPARGRRDRGGRHRGCGKASGTGPLERSSIRCLAPR